MDSNTISFKIHRFQYSEIVKKFWVRHHSVLRVLVVYLSLRRIVRPIRRKLAARANRTIVNYHLLDDFRVGGSFGDGLLLLLGQNTLKSFVITRPSETKIRRETKSLTKQLLVAIVPEMIISIHRISRRFFKSARLKMLSVGVTSPPLESHLVHRFSGLPVSLPARRKRKTTGVLTWRHLGYGR